MKADRLRVGDVVIAEVDIASLSDAEIDEINVFGNAMKAESHPEDPPTPDEHTRVALRNLPDFVVLRYFLARYGGKIVGGLNTSWLRTQDNQHILQTSISVGADHRRRGIGTALLRTAVDVARDAGKTLLMGGTRDRVPAGEAFARRVGAEAGLIGHTNRLVLADVDRSMLKRWIDEGPQRAPGYSLVTVDGPYPDDLIDQIVDIIHVMNTAPRENLDMEDMVLTVEVAREGDKAMFATGAQRRFAAARHDASGELVGFTELNWNPAQPTTMWQLGTGVRPAHRGHALGKWLKAMNVQRVLDEYPGVFDIRTHNADSNDAMLGINRALGFKPYTTDINWQLRVEAAESFLASE